MIRALLASASVLAALPALAQEAAIPDAELNQGDIIVTATKRAQMLSDVPIAVSAVTAESLQNSGATDIRQLNQLSPSLLVSSTSSETSGAVARIRGIGTVGDNAGLESSVAVFIDGVYRSRTGAGLTELGAIERIEVLRGPQGTLFGRNASAGLINVVTQRPSFEIGGNAELTYGNYNFWRLVGGITGPITADTIAGRIDAVYTRRDGFITDVISGEDLNDRDRWLVRGQLLIQPNDDLDIRLVGDYARRTEACCASGFLPFEFSRQDATGNLVVSRDSPIARFVRGLGGVITDDTYARQTSVTPGRGYDGRNTDWGLSAEINWDFGAAALTSITGYRDWKTVRNQDADYTNLDILEVTDNSTQFRTFSQEIRLNGTAFDDRLDWLIGGYYADEKLDFTSTTSYGADYTRFINCRLAEIQSRAVGIPGLVNTADTSCFNRTIAAGIPSATIRGLAGLSPLGAGGFDPRGGFYNVAAAIGQGTNTLDNRGIIADVYRQNSRNYAFFTHNVFDIVEDRLSLTLGLRYTNERKRLSVNLADDNTLCRAIATSSLAGLAGLPCVIPAVGSFAAGSVKKEDQVTGTAVLSWKPVPELLTYASYAKGYKAGGFNLDRSSFRSFLAPSLEDLKFEPELVDSFEIGAKLDLADFKLNVAAFHAEFSQFQLNAFNGVNFVVENIQSCSSDLGGGDRDFANLPLGSAPTIAPGPGQTPASGRTAAQAAATGACPSDDVRAGVLSTGVEVEAAIFPAPDLAFNLGFTYANTRYRSDLTGVNGRPLGPAFFNLPGNRISNAPDFVQTGAVTWTPPINDQLSALVYADYRFQSGFNTGSDLFPEKIQRPVTVVNARIGLSGPDGRWAIEAWAQNLFDEDYTQVGFNSPLLGGETRAAAARSPLVQGTQLFGAFLAEPRTFGVTVRTRF